jgi:hypothetical protein
VVLRQSIALKALSGIVVASAALLLSTSAIMAQSADSQSLSGGSNTSANVETATTLSASPVAGSMSGGNVFDFSSSGRTANPNAPSLGSFAGGPCIGEQRNASTSIAGIALGGGMATIDESCSRRNWIQTLIGASQHMPEADAAVLRRLALEVMRDDPLLEPALARMGLSVNSVTQTNSRPAARRANGDSEIAPSRSTRPVARVAEGCAVVLASNAPAGFVSLLSDRGCEINIR